MKKSNKFKNVMVLGGSGQIGKPLCEYLARQGMKIYNIDLIFGQKHDLREESELVEYWMQQVDFVFFLAYDIGGSKFLQTKQGDFDFLMNNTKITANVFSLIKKYNKPFIFASSTMTGMPWSSYGNLKKLGEHFTESLGGITARFWNVYGPEHDELKSHVITDFIRKAKTTGTINMLTDGTELRQMLFAEDCSKALYALAKNYQKAKVHKKFDIAAGTWVSIYEIAEIIAKHFKANINKPNCNDVVQLNSKIEPDLKSIKKFWDPNTALSIEKGIEKMIKYFEEDNG